MRRLDHITVLIALLFLFVGSVVLPFPRIAYAACGFGSSTGGTNPSVTTASAESFTPSTASLFGDTTNAGGAGSCRGFLTTTGAGTFTVPSDWNNANNTFELIGGGVNGVAGASGGSGGAGDGGGGGSSYSNISNQSLSGTVGYVVGAVQIASLFCSDNTGNCTQSTGCINAGSFGTSVIVAACPGVTGSGTTGGVGGTRGIGTTRFLGGTGAAGGGSGAASGGGGGAAGLNGIGGNGSGTTGGTGDNGTTAAGANGTEWDATHGSGGGGAGKASSGVGGNGGTYGAGGGGGKGSGNAGGSGANGIIVITYTPSGSITQEGFAYSTDSTLSTGVSTTTLGSQSALGSFTSSITGLSQNTTYYYRAYATNSVGTSTGGISRFTTGNSTPSRHVRLFEGFRIKLLEGGRFKFLQQ